MSRFTRAAVAVVVLGVLGVASASSASASSGRDFAEHVRACQEAMGFNGEHNPGVMHQGFAGWHEGHGC